MKMPLPLFIIAGAVITGGVGIEQGIAGACKIGKANKLMKVMNEQYKKSEEKFERHIKTTSKSMDDLGKLELQVLNQFANFSDLIEKIQNQPQFKKIQKAEFNLPEYDREELKKVSIGSGILLGGLSGAAVGTAGGFAAAGATTSAVMALGTASTGTAISSLSGVAATNATLATLGGGSLAIGGGGIALGTTVLGMTAVGVSLLVGGVIFNKAGEKIENNATEAEKQIEKSIRQIESICEYLRDLEKISVQYKESLEKAYGIYLNYFNQLSDIVNSKKVIDWKKFARKEKIVVQNTIMLVQLLYKMCQVKLVEKSANEEEINRINKKEIDEVLLDCHMFLKAL